jgi:hypothetical protein
MKPEEALAEARRRAAEAGRSEPAGPAPGGPPTLDELREWAVISVDADAVYSTRKGGAPITFFKRLLLRMLRQYTAELEAQQTRFNAAVVAHLEARDRD